MKLNGIGERLTGRWSSLSKALVALLLVSAALAAPLAGTASAAGVVPTANGPVRGTETPTIKEYLGIPYAAPPVSNLRWRPPQPAARWRGPLDATKFAPHCAQAASSYGFQSTSEDCLYLNVFAPNRGGKGHAKHLPVLFWIHGGDFVVGESDDYDPTRIVQRGVVVVTINYRLGYLGFLAHPALSAESASHSSGDYGLMDQQAALRWVQRNITKFGGDPNNVTIDGQSAGGLSVHSQLASPSAAGLFQRAIAQSGAYATALPSLAQAEAKGTAVARQVSCPDQTAACLRSVPVEELLKAQPTTPGSMLPNVDGDVLPQSIGTAFQNGQFNQVPVIEGSTHDEFTIFIATAVRQFFGGMPVPAFLYPTTVSLLRSQAGLHPTTAEIVAEYPIGNYSSTEAALSAIGTDAVFACPGRRTAQALSQFVTTYAYEFNDPNPPQPFVPPAWFPFGSYHASELAFLFDSPLRGGHAPLTADEETLAATMIGYWTQFARAGSPNYPGAPEWPAYTAANDAYLSLVPPTPRVTTGFAADHHCAFWDSK